MKVYAHYYTYGTYIHVYTRFQFLVMLTSPLCTHLKVTVGRRVGVQVGTLEYTIDPIIIIVPVVAGAMIISGVMMILIICCVCCRYKSKEKERDRQFQGLITQMELMESELADECRRGGLAPGVVHTVKPL